MKTIYKLSSLRVDEVSLYSSHHKITFKGREAEKVAVIKAHIGSLLYDSIECQQSRQPPVKKCAATGHFPRWKLTGKGRRRWSCRFKPKTDFIPKPGAETSPPSKYGRKRARVERDNYVRWDNIVFGVIIILSTPV